jgi:hypothetical protein
MTETVTVSPSCLRRAAEREGINLELLSSNGFPVEDIVLRPQDGTDIIAKLNPDRKVVTVQSKSLIGDLFLSLLVQGYEPG